MKLLDWQRPLAAKLIRMMRGSKCNLVALPTGSGKTYLSTYAVKVMKLKPLVICPKSAVSSWKAVLGAFGVEPLDILNWEKLKTGKTPWLKGGGDWHLPKSTCVIIDEVHRGCSGIDTKIGLAAVNLKRFDVHVLMMSATVAASPLQLRHSGFLLGLHGWVKGGFFAWCKGMGCYYNETLGHWMPPKGKNLQEVMQRIRNMIPNKILHLKVSEIPNFPESIIEAKLFDLDKEDVKMINKAWDDMSEHMKKPGVSELAEMTKARHRTEWIKCSLLADLVTKQLEDGNSVVVFMNFKDTTHRLTEMLKNEKGISNISILTGDSTPDERKDAMELFQNNKNHVFICTTGAGGVAISLHDVLQERPRVAYINPSYSASETKQALGRIARVGGTKSVSIFPLAADTIEERVYRAIMAKCKAIETLNDGDLR